MNHEAEEDTPRNPVVNSNGSWQNIQDLPELRFRSWYHVVHQDVISFPRTLRTFDDVCTLRWSLLISDQPPSVAISLGSWDPCCAWRWGLRGLPCRETKKRPKNDTSCERSIRWHIQNAFTIFCTKSFKVSFKRNILTEENGKHGKQLYNLLSQSSQWKYGFRFWNEPFPLAQIARQSIVSLSIIQQWWVFMHDTMILFMLVVLVLRWNTDWRPFATLLSSQGRFSWSPGLWNTRDRHGGRRQLKLAGPRANTGEATSTDEVEENNSWMMITSSHAINEI